MPEVKITDSEGRYIVISPEQAEVVSSKMEGIACWLEDAEELDDNAGSQRIPNSGEPTR